ncbi:MAG: hypothetical protein R2856_26735 [Caldilineaceae bacterium]
MTFDVYVIRSWDGNQVEVATADAEPTNTDVVGPDRWRFSAGDIHP